MKMNWVSGEPLRNIDPRKSVESVLAFVESHKLPDHVREDFLSSYEGDRFVESLRFLRSYNTELPVLGELLPTIESKRLTIGAVDGVAGFRRLVADSPSGGREFSDSIDGKIGQARKHRAQIVANW
jgi:hypothetical protein